MEIDEVAFGVAHSGQPTERTIARLLVDGYACAAQRQYHRVDIIDRETDGNGRF